MKTYDYTVFCKKRYKPYQSVTVNAINTHQAEQIAKNKILPGCDLYEAYPVSLKPLFYDDLVSMGVDAEVADYMTDMGAPPIEIGNDGRIYVDGVYRVGITVNELNETRHLICE